MPYWDCPRCAAENSLNATSCWRCGYQYYPGYQGSSPPRGEWSRELKDLVEKQRRTIQADLEKSLEDARQRSKAPPVRSADSPPRNEPENG